MKTYKEVLSPHIKWIKEQISIANERERKEGKDNIEIEIGIKLDDIKNAMGSEFVGKNDNTMYSMLRDIFLENGIKTRQQKTYDNNLSDYVKVLYLSFAKDEEIISTKDAIFLRGQKTGEKQGIDGNYYTYRQHERGFFGPMDENPECTHYFGSYIEQKYVMTIFEDVQRFEYPKNEYGRIIDLHKPCDWICKNGYKIKHVASCIREDRSHLYRDGSYIPYFHFLTKRNKDPDYWMLSGWDNRESLEPLFLWMIKGEEDFVTQAGRRPFWDRESFTIYITKKGLNRMSGYLIENKLDQLKDVCNIVKIEKEDMNKKNKEVNEKIEKYLNRQMCKRGGNIVYDEDILKI